MSMRHISQRTSASVKGLTLLAALLLAIGSTFAQQFTGSLTGIVMDKSGAVIPAAKIVMRNEASGDTRRTETNAEGYFSVQSVFAGTYSVNIEAPGFSTYRIEKMNFGSGEKLSLGEITLEVGTTGTEVQVVAASDVLVPVDTGEKAVVIGSKQLRDVSIVGRSAAEFIKILPGMTPTGGLENRPGFNGENIGINGNGDGGKQSAIGNFSPNGQRTGALDITADGAHVSDPGCNCATPINPNPEFIEELKIQSSNFSAENAKGPVVMNAHTKAGGRDFHGALYMQARHFSMNSNDALNNANGAKRPENKYFFPGFHLSGPVLIPGTGFNKNRDKLFFSTGFEYYKQTIDTGLLRSVVPTEAMRNGDFSNTAYLNALNKATPVAGADISAMYPNRRIPQSEIDPGMRALMSLVPLPNTDPAGVGNGFNWIRVLEVDQNMKQSLSRVDYNISDNTKLFVRYNFQSEVQPFPIQLWWRNAGAVPLPTAINGKNRSDSISTNFTKVLSPTLTNEFVFGYTFVDFPNEYQDYSKLTKASVGYPYQGIFKQDDKIPGFLSWAGPTAGMYLTGGFDPVLFATKHLITATNNVSKVLGTHTLKFGGYYGQIINKQPGDGPSAGTIFFSPWHSLTSGNVLADMVRGAADSFTQNTQAIVRAMGWKEIAFFAQDAWKVSPRVTLEYGLRAQHMQPWTARNEFGIATWDPSRYNPSARADQFPGIAWHGIDESVPLSGWKTKPLYLAPRLGFAWDVFGRGSTVFRGGFGTFVWHDSQLAAASMDLPAGLRSTTVGGGVLLRDVDRTTAAGNLVFNGEAVDGNDDGQPTTYSWSATISQRLPGRTLFEVSYVGNRSTNLVNLGDLRNVNPVPIGAMLNNPTGNPNDYRPLRLYQNLLVNSHNWYSRYNSLQATVTKQTGALNTMLSYTWSKAMGIVDNPINLLDRDANYGPLPSDRTHVFSASYVYSLPNVSSGANPFLKGLANGWQLSGIVQAWSGVNLQQANGNDGTNFNLNVAYQGRSLSNQDVLGTNAIKLMPRVTCDPRSGLQENQYINPSCFAAPIPGSNGQVGVNGPIILPYMRGPGFFNTDLSLFKNFAISERQNLRFQFSAYNLPNHPNRSFISSDQNLRLNFNDAGQLTNQRFGFADYKVGRRIVQLGIRYSF